MFDFLNIKKSEPDIDIIQKINDKGFNFFTKYLDDIERLELNNNKENNDYKYYVNYLNYFFTENIFEQQLDVCFVEAYYYIEEHGDGRFLKYLSNENIGIVTNKLLDLIMFKQLITCKNVLLIDILMEDKRTYEFIASHPMFVPKTRPISSGFMFSYISKSTNFNSTIEKLVRNKTSRNNMLIWICKFYDCYKHFISITNMNSDEIRNIVKYKTNIYKMLHCLFYIYEKGFVDCSIEETIIKISKFELIDDNEFNSDNYTFLNKLFILIHKYTSIAVISNIQQLKDIKRDINYFEEKLETLNKIEINQITYTEYDNHVQAKVDIERKIQYLNILNNDLESIKNNNKVITNFVYNFYNNHTMKWLNSRKELCDKSKSITDDMLNNYKTFSSEPENKQKVDYIDNEHYELIFKIMDSNDLTNNHGVKKIFLMKIVELFNNKNSFIINTINKDNTEFIDKIINWYIYFNTIDDIEEKYIANYYIIKILNKIDKLGSNNILTTYLIQLNKNKENNNFDKFVNILIGNHISLFDELLKIIRNLHRVQYNKELLEDDKSDEEILIEHFESLNSEFFDLFVFVTKHLISHFPESLLKMGIKDKFTCFINYLLNELVGENKHNLKLNASYNYDYRPIDYLEFIFKIYFKFMNNKVFVNSIIQDSRYYNYKLSLKFLDILIKKNIILTSEYTHCINSFKIINEEGIKQNELDEEEYPDEYCDPIMGTLIKDPVMLPNTDIIMDKEVITRYILSDEKNPFNREKLTIELLNEFNKKPEVLEKCNELKEKINSY